MGRHRMVWGQASHQACVVQRLVSGLQQQPLVWIHGPGLDRGDAKEPGVKHFHIVCKSGPEFGRHRGRNGFPPGHRFR